MGGRKTAGSFLFLFGCPKRKENISFGSFSFHAKENEQDNLPTKK